MKQIAITLLMTVFLCSLTQSVTAGEKQDKRLTYILSGIKLSKDKTAKVKPIIAEFVEKLHANKKQHDTIKDKYAQAEEADKLTDAEADELMQSKLRKDQEENNLRKVYYNKLKPVIGAASARKVISLSDDKLKKK